MIDPIDTFQGCVFHCLEMSPRAALLNDLRLVHADDRLGPRVVVRIDQRLCILSGDPGKRNCWRILLTFVNGVADATWP